jgi:glycerol 2-dehydrogenase (NADP+)
VRELPPRDVPRSPSCTDQIVCHILQLQRKGKARSIGVSNWSIANLENLLANATITPAANQVRKSPLSLVCVQVALILPAGKVENHPYLPQDELLEYCKSKGIVLQAYSPLGSTSSHLRDDKDIAKIAEKHNVEVSNVLISWQGTMFFCSIYFFNRRD